MNNTIHSTATEQSIAALRQKWWAQHQIDLNESANNPYITKEEDEAFPRNFAFLGFCIYTCICIYFSYMYSYVWRQIQYIQKINYIIIYFYFDIPILCRVFTPLLFGCLVNQFGQLCMEWAIASRYPRVGSWKYFGHARKERDRFLLMGRRCSAVVHVTSSIFDRSHRIFQSLSCQGGFDLHTNRNQKS